MVAPTHAQLRALAAAGALLVLAGAFVGWFERSPAAAVDPAVTVVRPGDVLGLGVLGWLPLVLLAAAGLAAPRSRRGALIALVCTLPGLVLIVLAGGLRVRTAVSGETIGEVVADRTLGQALSLVGALLVIMALGAAWRHAPDWRIPQAWAQGAVTGP